MEILLVIAIMAILSTSGFNGWQNYRQRVFLEQTSANLLAFLSQVQQRANWHNETYLLRQSTINGQYCISYIRDVSNTGCFSDIGLTFIFPDSNFTLDITQSEIGLGFYGLRNTSGSGNIIISNDAGRVRLVLSSRGRLRRCSESINGHQPYLPGISAC